MGRRSDHSREELQKLIIDATLALVREHGAGKVTARQIAKQVGYTPGMLYSVFINLSDIFSHVNQIGLQTLHTLCTEAVNNSEDPELAIKAMGKAYVSFAATHTHQFNLMFTSRQEKETVPTHSVTHQIGALFSLVEIQLRHLNPSASEDQVTLGARALWSGIHGTAALFLSNQLYLDVPEADRKIVEMLVSNFIISWKN